jgi:Leucine-rich repeat (LRR) protein
VVIVATSWRRNPILDLEDQGWKVHQTDKALELEFDGPLPGKSLQALQRIAKPLEIRLRDVDTISVISDWTALKYLTTLDLSTNAVSDVSPLKDLKNLTTLYLSFTKVTDVSPLKDLKNLQIIGP